MVVVLVENKHLAIVFRQNCIRRSPGIYVFLEVFIRFLNYFLHFFGL